MGMLSFLKHRLSHRVGVEHRTFQEMSGTVLGGVQAPCPRCRRGRLQADSQALDLRRCDDAECGASFSLAEIGQSLAVSGASLSEVADEERRQATALCVAAEIVVVAAAAWAIWSGSWTTLLGAVLLAVVICASALVARYRAWQIENGRMFERRAPIGAFLRAETAGLFGRR
ncbi:MAG: hypothetical protein WAP03_30095 [Methylorubrum rhodinum]|uniref:hypothetical protein n=1 Tax=Methylorubrum rhodinum TaxID=29428 RepID=UPI003BAFB56B